MREFQCAKVLLDLCEGFPRYSAWESYSCDTPLLGDHSEGLVEDNIDVSGVVLEVSIDLGAENGLENRSKLCVWLDWERVVGTMFG
jgi:hypothetical protein